MRKRNYLNNKDILKEIHKSKNTFNSYVDKEYGQFDIILLADGKSLNATAPKTVKVIISESESLPIYIRYIIKEIIANIATNSK